MKFHHLLILSITLFSQVLFAAHIEKMKGKKALVVLDGLEVNIGDTIYALDPNTNKKTAVLKVTKVAGEKAVAQTVKGKAKANQEIQAKSAQSAAELPTSKKSSKTSSSESSDSTFAIGGLFGVGLDTMEINIGSPSESISQTGMGFSLMGAADFKMTDWFSVRGLVGVEQFNVKADSTLGSTPCDTCETKITYFTGIAWGRVHIVETVWLGVGLGLQHPLSTETNALDESTVGTSVVYGFGGGADIAIGDDMYIPVQIEYGLQPESEGGDVSSSYYGIRIGFMLRY